MKQAAFLVCLISVGLLSAQAQDETALLRNRLNGQPDSAVLKRQLGELLFHADPNNIEAGQLLQQAVTASPRDPEARHFYAQWAYFNNREQICADQEKAALLLPKVNDLALLQMYTLNGFCNNRLGKIELADSAFSKAYQVDQRQATFDPAIAYRYEEFLAKQGRNSEAQRVVETVLQRAPRFGPAHLEQAKFYQHQSKWQDAIGEAKLALEGDGNDAQSLRAAHMILVKGYFALGDTEKTKQEQQWIEAQIVNPVIR